MSLRIFVDFVLSPKALQLLKKKTGDHELIFPEKAASSVLSKTEWDPKFAAANIAFGQPHPSHVEKADRLKWIQVSTSGITRYDNPEFRKLAADRNIAVSNSASVYSEPCADHVLSFMLAQSRNLPQALHTRTADGTDAWNELRYTCRSLRGQRVLILGFGTIGRELVKLLRTFDMKIVACRRKARGDEGVPVITEEQLPQILTDGVDHIVNILPDNPSTRHFFNASRFSTIKPGAIFYNIGRGTTVDQNALLEALKSERVKAAWLDVTDPEPLPEDHPLFSEPNCYLTPHIAGGHVGEAETLVRHFLQNLERFLKGEPLSDQVM